MKKLFFCLFLFTLFITPAFAESPFPDVPEYHEYANEINYVKVEGIVNGYSDGLFRPESGIRRGELTKIVINSKYSQGMIDDCISGREDVFPDVPYNHTFAKYICLGEENDVVDGYSDGYFRPDEFVTFGQAAKIILRTLDDEADIQEDAELETYIERLDEKGARPVRLASASKDEVINRGEVSFLIQMVLDSYNPLPDEPQAPFIGYAAQQITTDVGTFAVEFVAADLATTKIITDTAVDSDCTDDCPVKPLAQYIAENGAYAGVNGTYFCPETYPECADKSNTFDPLVLSADKVFINSEKNRTSPNPVAVFGNDFVRFIPHVSDWEQDSSVNGAITNYPLLVSNSQVAFTAEGEVKMGIKSNRSFVAHKGTNVFIGVAYNVTVAESAQVMKAMNMGNAINLDAGYSTALWYEGSYKAGPGRNLPNVVMFVRK